MTETLHNKQSSTASKEHQVKFDNPYAPRRPAMFRWKGSVIPNVLPSTLVCTAVAVIVTCLYELTSVKLSIPQTFIPVLGFVVGLLLTYRTNTAYDRYWEGRRLWSTMVVAIRQVARLIWVTVDDSETSVLLEKKTAINLLGGFSVATKHYLREEEGTHWDDLKPFISNISSRLPGFEALSKKADRGSVVLLPGVPYQRNLKPHERPKGTPSIVNHNIPLEISLFLSSYFKILSLRKSIDPATWTAMNLSLNMMVDCLTGFERILRSPIPVAYSVHLAQTVWVYCVTLPFQLVSLAHWITIPIVFFATIVLLGIERIGAEIENPFGYDENDLDLDDFCDLINKELAILTARPPPNIEDLVFNPQNHPFGKEDITASEARELPIDEVRSLLSVTDSNEAPQEKKDLVLKLDGEGDDGAPPQLTVNVLKLDGEE